MALSLTACHWGIQTIQLAGVHYTGSSIKAKRQFVANVGKGRKEICCIFQLKSF